MGSCRSIPPDSTAGVSLSGLTDYTPMRPEGVLVTSPESPSTDVSGSEDHEMAGASLSLDNNTSLNGDVALGPVQLLGGNKRPMPSLVFNVMRADNINRRDLISLQDVEDAT